MGLTKVVYSSLIRNFANEKQRVNFYSSCLDALYFSNSVKYQLSEKLKTRKYEAEQIFSNGFDGWRIVGHKLCK